MALKVTKTDVWVAEIEDQPGGLAAVTGVLADAGASLEFAVARRQAEKPGKGLVFVTPLKGKKLLDAAASAGFHKSARIATLKVEGNDRRGMGTQIARAVADAGVNMRGLSGAVIARKFVCYLAFDNQEDANKAAVALRAFARKLK